MMWMGAIDKPLFSSIQCVWEREGEPSIECEREIFQQSISVLNVSQNNAIMNGWDCLENHFRNNLGLNSIFDKLWMKEWIEWFGPHYKRGILINVHVCVKSLALCWCKWDWCIQWLYNTLLSIRCLYVNARWKVNGPLVNVKWTVRNGIGLRLKSRVYMLYSYKSIQQ